MGYRSFEDEDFPVSKPVDDLSGEMDDVEKAEQFIEKYEGGGAAATSGGLTRGDSAEQVNEATEGIEDDSDPWDENETGDGGTAADEGLDDDID